MRRCGWLLMALVLLATACSSGSSTQEGGAATSSAPPSTQSAPRDAQTECRAALSMVDAYVVAKQAGRTDVADPADARQRCLATPDIPAPCVEAMKISATIATVAANSVEFISSFTSYGEFSALCRVKVLRSI